MIRRDARLRLEYVYRKSLEEKQRLIDEKRQTVKKYVNENRPIPTHLKKDAIDLQQDAEWGGESFVNGESIHNSHDVFPSSNKNLVKRFIV